MNLVAFVLKRYAIKLSVLCSEMFFVSGCLISEDRKGGRASHEEGYFWLKLLEGDAVIEISLKFVFG